MAALASADSTTKEPTKRQLVGFDNFKRHNPLSDKFEIKRFHSMEFYCNDATNVSRRFLWGLGMQQISKSDLSTGNKHYASYVLRSGDIVFAFTSPYSASSFTPAELEASARPFPTYDQGAANEFIQKHGLAVKCVTISVGDAEEAFKVSVANGGVPVTNPTTLVDKATGTFGHLLHIISFLPHYIYSNIPSLT